MQTKLLSELIQKLKPGVIYNGKPQSFDLLQYLNLFHNKMNKQMQSYLERYGMDANNKYFLPNPVMREVYKGKRSFTSNHKNLLKEYLESSQYRKKLRKAGIPENQIQERINGLHDTQVRIDKANTLGNPNGMSFTLGEQVIFNPNKLYIDRGELIQHELAHQVDLTHTANSTSLLKTGMPYKDMNGINSNKPLLENQSLRYQHNKL